MAKMRAGGGDWYINGRPSWAKMAKAFGVPAKSNGMRMSTEEHRRLTDARQRYEDEMSSWVAGGKQMTGGSGGPSGSGGTGSSVSGGGGLKYGSRDDMIGSLIRDAQAKQAQANAANEGRYQQLLSGYTNLQNRNQQMYAGLGNEQRAEVGRSYENLAMRQHKNVVARGLGSSTISGSMRRGLNREATQQKNLITERIGQQKIGDYTRLGQARLGVIENRNDVGPDMNAIYGLASQYGQGQGVVNQSRGGGGGGGYGGGAPRMVVDPVRRKRPVGSYGGKVDRSRRLSGFSTRGGTRGGAGTSMHGWRRYGR